MIETRPLSENLGVEVLNIDLAEVAPDEVAELYRLWQREPLVLLRRQCVTESELVCYSRNFGELEIVVRDELLSKTHPEVIYVTNLKSEDGTGLGGLGSYELNWHHDQIYRQRPATGSIFLAVEVPEGQARTSWCSTARTFDALPGELKARIEGRRSVCKYGLRADWSFTRDYDEADADKVKAIHDRTPPAVHPMVLEQPLTGEKSLYVDPMKVFAVEGMPDTDAQSLLDELRPRLIEQWTYTHDWRPGDVVMWDNSRLMHRRDAFDASLPRLAKRTTIFMNPDDFAVPQR